MAVKSYRDLIVWQKSIKLVSNIYKITQGFPKEEIYSLTSQIRRAAISIPSNIAEGWGRNGIKEYIHFLGIAKGSLLELETQLIISNTLDYLNEDRLESILKETEEISKMLNGLMKNLRNKG